MLDKNISVSKLHWEEIPACGVVLANEPGLEAGYIWSKNYGWQARIYPQITPNAVCGYFDANHRRCERCMRAVGAIW